MMIKCSFRDVRSALMSMVLKFLPIYGARNRV
jgi:hypothetical protein